MVEGFFLYGVYVSGAGHGIDEGVKRALLIDPNPAYSSLILTDDAMVPAQIAEDLPAFKFLVKSRFMHEHPPIFKSVNRK